MARTTTASFWKWPKSPRSPVWLRSRPSDLCNYVSNPIDLSPLSREPYDPEVEERLRQMIDDGDD
jgi:hypothetical protein